jgi:hypothetical protein
MKGMLPFLNGYYIASRLAYAVKQPLFRSSTDLDLAWKCCTAHLQIPRLYNVYKETGVIENFQQVSSGISFLVLQALKVREGASGICSW